MCRTNIAESSSLIIQSSTVLSQTGMIWKLFGAMFLMSLRFLQKSIPFCWQIHHLILTITAQRLPIFSLRSLASLRFSFNNRLSWVCTPEVRLPALFLIVVTVFAIVVQFLRDFLSIMQFRELTSEEEMSLSIFNCFWEDQDMFSIPRLSLKSSRKSKRCSATFRHHLMSTRWILVAKKRKISQITTCPMDRLFN